MKTFYIQILSSKIKHFIICLTMLVSMQAFGGVINYYSSIYNFALNYPATMFGPKIAGGSVPTNYIISPALPAGLSINATSGVITGTPTVLSPLTSYRIKAVLPDGDTTYAGLSVEVTNPAPADFSYPSGLSFAPTMTISLSPTRTASGQKTLFTTTSATGANYAAADNNNVYISNANNAYVTVTSKLNPGSPADDDSIPEGSGITAITANTQGNIFFLRGDTVYGMQSYTSSPQFLLARTGITNLACDNEGEFYFLVPSTEQIFKYSFQGVQMSTYSPLNSTLSYLAVNPVTQDVYTYINVAGAVAGIFKVPSYNGFGSAFLTYENIAVNGLSVDAFGNMYVLKSNGTTLVQGEGTQITSFNFGAAYSQMSDAVDASGNIYAGTQNSTSILKFAGYRSADTLITYSISPALPAGMSIDPNTGVISGTPTAQNPQTTYTVTATSQDGGTNQTQVNITIAINGASIAYGAYTYNFALNYPVAMRESQLAGSFSTFAISPALPAGLSMDYRGDITGTPTAVSPATAYTVSTTYYGAAVSVTLNLSVTNPVPPDFSYASSPVTLSEWSAILPLAPNKVAAGQQTSFTATSATGQNYVAVESANNYVYVSNPNNTYINMSSKYTPATAMQDGTTPEGPRVTLITSNNLGHVFYLLSNDSIYEIQSPNATPLYIANFGDIKGLACDNADNIYLLANSGTTITKCYINPAGQVGQVTRYTFAHTTFTYLAVNPFTQDIYTQVTYSNGATAIEKIGAYQGTMLESLFDLNVTNLDGLATDAFGNIYELLDNGEVSVVKENYLQNQKAVSIGSFSPGNIYSGISSAVDGSGNIYLGTTDQASINKFTGFRSADTLITYSISPALPTGLSLDPNTGIISGTPIGSSPSTVYTITANTSGGSNQTQVTIAVPSTLAYTSTAYNFAKGQPVSMIAPTATSLASATVSSFSIQPALTKGLSFNTVTGVISGPPTDTMAAASYTITATFSDNTTAMATLKLSIGEYAPGDFTYGASQTYTQGVVITPLAPSSVSAGTKTILGTLPNGLSSIAVSKKFVYVVASPGHSGAIYSVSKATGNSTIVENQLQAENVAVDDSDNIYFTSGQSVYKTQNASETPVEIGSFGNFPDGLAVDSAGNVYVASYTNLTKFFASGGSQTLSYSDTHVYYLGVNPVTQDVYEIVAPVSNFSNDSMYKISPDFSVKTLLAQNLGSDIRYADAFENIFGFSPSSLIKMLETGATTQVLGTQGLGPADGFAADASGDVYEGLYGGSSNKFNVTVARITGAMAAKDTNFTITPALPAGLTLNPSTGVISGTPLVTDTATYIITATNSGGSNSDTIQIAVAAPPPAGLTYSTPNNLLTGYFITPITPTSTGGAITKYTISPALPEGLAIDSSTGSIGGITDTVSATTSYVITGSNSAGSTTDTIQITIRTEYDWQGFADSNWNNPQNWQPQGVPGAQDVAVIVSGPYNPVVSTNDSVNTVSVGDGGVLTVAKRGSLTILGDATIVGTTLDASAGTINFCGTVRQNIAASIIAGSLTVNNPAGVTLVANGGIVMVTGLYTPVAGTLTTNGELLLASTAAGTASVAQGNGVYISGNVTVQKYIPAKRAWHLLTAPLNNTGSIYANWQNNGVVTDSTGTDIWSPAGGGGFTTGGSFTSARQYNYTSNAFVNLANTNATLLSGTNASAANNALFLYITGPYGSDNINSGRTATTLNASGQLQQGTQVFNFTGIAPGGYVPVGNPYASPVDFTGLSATNLQQTFWAWDPARSGTSAGGFVTISWDAAANQYDADIPPAQTSQTNVLQSGQAVLMRAQTGSTSGSVTFNESNKIGTAGNSYASSFLPGANASAEQMRITLNRGAGGVAVDGALVKFGSVYSASVNDDAGKQPGFNENLSLKIGTGYFAIVRRPEITGTDTIWLNTSRLKADSSYTLNIQPQNLNTHGLQPVLADKYLGTKTNISIGGTTVYPFNVTSDAASASASRFSIVTVGNPVTQRVTICSTSLPYTWNGNDYDSSGTYTAHLTDSLGVDSTVTLVLTVNPSPTAIYVSGRPAICYGARAYTRVIVKNGTAPYQYSVDGVHYQDSGIFRVPAGNYSVIVKDAAGCTVTSNSLDITQPAQILSLNLAASGNCSGGSITANASGSYGNYQYSLDDINFQASGTLSIASAGAYTVYVKDQGGCKNKRNITINPLSATLKALHTEVCYGAREVIQARAKNGTSPYTYSLDGINYQDSAYFNLQAGTYSVTVKDATGCTAISDSVTITQPSSQLRMSINPTNVTCNGGSDGSLTVSPTGGYSFSYLYSLNGGSYQASDAFSGLSAGTFTVTVKDSDGCVNNKNAIITQPVTPCTATSSLQAPSSTKAEMMSSLKIKVYPNPSINDFNLVLEGGDSKKIVELRVVDMLGKTVYHTTGSVFDMYKFGNTFAGGIYIAEVLNGRNIKTVKLVKGN